MNASAKQRLALERRLTDWDNLPSSGMSGTRTKLVRRADGKGGIAYHRPGSQNRKKGAGRRRR